MPGTGSGFSGCGVCAGAGVCSSGVFDRETGVVTVCWRLGAMACVTGCADFFVSLLSHATSEINPAARIIIFKRFKQHSMLARALPSIIHFCWTVSSGARQHLPLVTGNKGRLHCPMNALKRLPKQA